MIAVTFALALAAAPSPAGAGACTLLNLAACRDVGPLVGDEGFRAALKAFVGQRRTGYLNPDGKAYGEAIAALSGPADPVRRLRNLYVFTACADAACEDQGAVVLQPDGELDAVAILHTDCNSTRRTSDCVDRQVLSILRRQDDDFSVVDNLSDWARRNLAAQPVSPTMGIKSLDRVEVIALSGGPPGAVAAKPPAGPWSIAPIQPIPPIAPIASVALSPTPALRPAPEIVAAPPASPRAPAPPAPPQDATQAPAADPTEPADTVVSAVVAVARPSAAHIPIPPKVYLTLNTDVPTIVVVPPPPPPPSKRHMEMWKWRWTPYG